MELGALLLSDPSYQPHLAHPALRLPRTGGLGDIRFCPRKIPWNLRLPMLNVESLTEIFADPTAIPEPYRACHVLRSFHELPVPWG
jgi:hypothetical protein